MLIAKPVAYRHKAKRNWKWQLFENCKYDKIRDVSNVITVTIVMITGSGRWREIERKMTWIFFSLVGMFESHCYDDCERPKFFNSLDSFSLLNIQFSINSWNNTQHTRAHTRARERESTMDKKRWKFSDLYNRPFDGSNLFFRIDWRDLKCSKKMAFSSQS